MFLLVEDPDGNRAEATNRLGVWYEKGKHKFIKNPQEAVHWYTLAATVGNGLAMHNLGDCYRNGIEVTADKEKAIELYREAAVKRRKSAARKLNDLDLK